MSLTTYAGFLPAAAPATHGLLTGGREDSYPVEKTEVYSGSCSLPRLWRDSAKWLGLSQMAGIQPSGLDSPKWLGLSQMTATWPNGCQSFKWFGLNKMAGTSSNYAKSTLEKKNKIITEKKILGALYSLLNDTPTQPS